MEDKNLQILLNTSCKLGVIYDSNNLYNLCVRLLEPGALPFTRDFMAVAILAEVMGGFMVCRSLDSTVDRESEPRNLIAADCSIRFPCLSFNAEICVA